MQTDQEYQRFCYEYKTDPYSDTCLTLARSLNERFPAFSSDMGTPITAQGSEETAQLGRWLRSWQVIPDILYVSPYVRAWASLVAILRQWPELGKVHLIEDNRLREQEHGLRLLYSDWRIFMALHPDQQRLLDHEGEYWYRYPQGESMADVRVRHDNWLNSLNRHAGQTVMAITHDVCIVSIRASLERLTVAECRQLAEQHPPRNSSLTWYKREQQLQLQDYDRLPPNEYLSSADY
jgi:broad specificity phosphatase PhoE